MKPELIARQNSSQQQELQSTGKLMKYTVQGIFVNFYFLFFDVWIFFSIIESFMDKEVTKTEAQSICGSVGMNLPLIQNSFGENEIFSTRNRLKISSKWLVENQNLNRRKVKRSRLGSKTFFMKARSSGTFYLTIYWWKNQNTHLTKRDFI